MSNDVSVQEMLDYLNERIYSLETVMALSPPIDQPPFHDEIHIINAIAERVQEMTAVEHLKARAKLCDDYRFVLKCDGKCFDRCARDERENPRAAVEIVKRWKEEQDGRAQTKS